MLSIPFGHTMAAIADVLGGVASVSAMLATRRKTVRLNETGEDLPMTAADQVLVTGLLESGAPISAHYRGGLPRGTGLLWEINGTEGDIQMTGSSGHTQFADLQVKGAHGNDEALIELSLPDALRNEDGLDLYAGNVARLYERLAADIRDGTRTAPTFDDAVVTHRLIAAIERSASDGCRIAVEDV